MRHEKSSQTCPHSNSEGPSAHPVPARISHPPPAATCCGPPRSPPSPISAPSQGSPVSSSANPSKMDPPTFLRALCGAAASGVASHNQDRHGAVAAPRLFGPRLSSGASAQAAISTAPPPARPSSSAGVLRLCRGNGGGTRRCRVFRSDPGADETRPPRAAALGSCSGRRRRA